MKRPFLTIKFFLERLLLRGAQYQLLIIAVLIVLISATAGLMALLLTSNFESIDKSAWWAFLRLSDPGYLGDDEGIALRIISTVVTVLGYVVFMGALIAILTQWLNRTLKTLESGLTAIHQRDHILILGWTNRTAAIVREMLVSQGRVGRFLKRIGAKKLHIVILSEEVNTQLAHELRADLGKLWHHGQVLMRSGTSLRVEHLERVDFMNAAAIILPGTDFQSEGSQLVDTRAIKTLMTISNHAARHDYRKPPMVVAEIFDSRKTSAAKSAYGNELEIVTGDAVISRLIAQNVRHQGLSHIYGELLTHNQNNEIFIRDCQQLEGVAFGQAFFAFSNSILLGVLRQAGNTLIPVLNPPYDYTLQSGDRLAVLARNYEATAPIDDYATVIIGPQKPSKPHTESIKNRLLVLGWNHKVPSLIQEFDSYANESFDIDLLSLMPVDQREETLSRYAPDLKHVSLRQLHGDYTAPSDLRHITPWQYDRILFLSNDRLDSNEESDARVILGSLMLREILPEGAKPKIIMELMDPGNEKLFVERTGEIIISPLILSHILAHVALRRELNIVFEELFTVGGAEIYFLKPDFYDIGQEELSFREIQYKVAQYGDIALGVRSKAAINKNNGGIVLNPQPETKFDGRQIDLVVLTTYI